ncbi:hypothetical protein SAMN04488037_102313 [Shimia marina]|uniref:Uncharacterized protein n=2 Tax=Shimia marina TaxID=321267 RepID=A0A0P1ESI8_9RHOB|nr:hypothetical protein SHM7688_02957 [Shimia marina]SFD75543.1 hypothetical protein SAMN04488037_102313 [Shimia marina]
MPVLQDQSTRPVVRAHWAWYAALIRQREQRFELLSSMLQFKRDLETARFPDAELRTVLQTRVTIASLAERRERRVLGRFYNWLSGEDSQYIRLEGLVLCDVLRVIGADVGDIIDMTSRYDLRIDVAQEAMELLSQT